MKNLLKFGALATMLSVFAVVSAQALPPKYHTYAGTVTELQALVAANPTICRLDSIGYSNRDSLTIYCLKISDNVSTEEDEPAILFCGGAHADEILGPEIVISFCQDIVAKYNSGDVNVLSYVNNNEIYCVPFVNPEGHVVVEQGDTDWRKNKTDNNHNGIFDYQDGVDNNRNYDFGWSIDNTPGGLTPESLMYKGPYPFSDSESRALRDFGLKYKPLVAVDYHSPTYGRSEKIYYNWYWYPSDGGNGMGPDEQSMHNIGIGFAASVINDRGDSTYEARRALVNKGDFKTYFYGNFGTASFVCEVSDTTIQDTSLVDSICSRNRAGMYYLLRRSGFARLTGTVTDSITGSPLEAEVEVQQATNADINPRLTRVNSGRYNRLIDPGTYTLVVSKTGYVTKTVTGVVVNNSAPTTTNVRLRPTGTLPGTPVLSYPTNNSIFNDSLALNFDWGDVTGATSYVIEISTTQNFASCFDCDSTVTPSTHRNTINFGLGTYYWRVTAHNSSGYSSRSTVWQLTIQVTPPPLPSTPTLLLPANASTFNDSLALNFDWSNSINATGYVFEIAHDLNFTSLFEIDSNLVVSNYRNATAFTAGTYYWRVTAFNVTGYSSRSTAWHFTIQITLPPPEAPTLIAPIDGFNSSSAFIHFDWNDPATALRYAIQIDSDEVFAPPLISDSMLTTSQYINIDSLRDNHYFWRVKAGNASGWSLYSSVYAFDVEVQGQIVYLVGDANHSGATNGLDVVYFVSYLKGGPPPPLNVNGFYPEADANGSCTVNGLDVTYMVSYFKGGPPLIDGHCLR
jgi:hypothetical protein